MTNDIKYNPCTATIGFFDGVHRGHQYLLDQLKADAVEHDLESMVITFRQHPRQVLQQDYVPKLLSVGNQKTELLRSAKVDSVVMLDFTKDMAAMTAHDFMVFMHDELNVKRLMMGYDNRFGHNRSDTFEDYQRYGNEIGIEVVQNDVLELEGVNVSSSAVRRLLEDGDIEEANEFLGHDYGFEGIVVHGHGEGRKLGFPTANIQTAPEQLILKRGVYAVKVWIEGYDNHFIGMMNIGSRPTYGTYDDTMEVNIFDFSNDIYDKEIYVSFIKRIRSEKKFSSPEELKKQLQKDKEEIIKNIQI